jgi:hypothetical protein
LKGKKMAEAEAEVVANEKDHLSEVEVLLKGVAEVQRVEEERKKEVGEPRKGARAQMWKAFVLQELVVSSRLVEGDLSWKWMTLVLAH